MYSLADPTVLLTLSVALLGVQARVPSPSPWGFPLVCYEDNQLRALERFPNYADEFCSEFLANTGRHPRWLDHWNKQKVSSACSCYQKTATANGATSAATATGTLFLASSTAPAPLSQVFATTSATGGIFPSMSASGGYLPSGTVFGSSGSAPYMTGSVFGTAPASTGGFYPSGTGYYPSGSGYGSTAPYMTVSVFGTAPASTGGFYPSGTGYYPSGSGYGSSGTAPSSFGAPLPPRSVTPVSSANAAYSTIASSSSAPIPTSQASSATAPSQTPWSTGDLPAGDNYPPQPPGAGPGKRGLCYDANTKDGWSNLYVGSHLAAYGSNWDVNRGTQLNQSFSYVPTIKVDAKLNNDDWNSTVPVLIEGGTKAMFASNEPDNAGQANLTPQQAAKVYQKYMQPYAGTVQLGTPAVTNGGGQTGLTYLQNFLTYCPACTFNFVNVHYYLHRTDLNTTQYASALKEYIDTTVPAVQAKHPQLKNLPIFIGEWWLWGASLDEGSELMDLLLPYLDGNPKVLGYQAFGGLWEGSFINADGTGLTAAGQKYKTWTAASPTGTLVDGLDLH